MHRLVGVDAYSYSGVRKVLRLLVAHGVAADVPGGYVLNREHVASRAIIELASLHGVLVERLTAWGAGAYPVEFVGLYGSVARRDGDELSDVDVLVVTADSTSDEQRTELRDGLTELLLLWTGNDGHVQVFTRSSLSDLVHSDAPIVEEWRRELQAVHGEPPNLRREAPA